MDIRDDQDRLDYCNGISFFGLGFRSFSFLGFWDKMVSHRATTADLDRQDPPDRKKSMIA